MAYSRALMAAVCKIPFDNWPFAAPPHGTSTLLPTVWRRVRQIGLLTCTGGSVMFLQPQSIHTNKLDIASSRSSAIARIEQAFLPHFSEEHPHLAELRLEDGALLTDGEF